MNHRPATRLQAVQAIFQRKNDEATFVKSNEDGQFKVVTKRDCVLLGKAIRLVGSTNRSRRQDPGRAELEVTCVSPLHPPSCS